MRAGWSGLLVCSLGLPCLLFASIASMGCGSTPPPQQPQKWTTGFWFWHGSAASVVAPVERLDVVYCQVGTIQKHPASWGREPWAVYGRLPEHLPPAAEYWPVFRLEEPGIPPLEAIPPLTRVVFELQAQARRRGLHLAGIQLDIDSPTRTLPQYAAFLRDVRSSLGPELQLSITALLDWFRPGTAISDVVNAVDEFVPQFYDAQDPGSDRTAIATRIDAARWGPVFNRHRRRFRIGISTFGRSRLVPGESSSRDGHHVRLTFADATPLDVGLDPAFHLQTSRTDAQELVLSYRAARKTHAGYTEFEPGDAMTFTLSTPEAIRAAVEQARLMRGYCAGVIFFRWPASDETLATQPAEILAAAGVPVQPPPPDNLQVVDGRCAAVYCADLYLMNASPLSAQAVRYRIASSNELEYFLPYERMPVRMSGPSQVELSLPPYCGRSRLYLGRVVAARRTEFTMEVQR